jgi:hypothetical protein
MWSVALGAAVAAVLVVARWERTASAQGVVLDRTLVGLLPPNATSLVGVDVERLKRTPSWRLFEERHGNDRHFDEFVRETGFDPRRDVEELLVASTGEKQFTAVARGTFNVSALTQVIKQKKAIVENYRGYDLFGPEKANEPGRFCFLDSRTVLAGSRPEVLAAIDRKASGGPSLLGNTSLLSRAQSISGAHQVWAISDNPGQLVARHLPRNPNAQASNFARIFQSMRTTSFALDLTGGLDLRAQGVCQSAQDAKTLADAARGLVAFGRLSASQKEPEMLNVLDGVQVEEKENELAVSVKLDQTSFEKLLEKTGPRKRRSEAQVE